MKKNSNKATLSYVAMWDNAFNDGYRAGYNNTQQVFVMDKTYRQAYLQGYTVGHNRALREQNNCDMQLSVFDSTT